MAGQCRVDCSSRNNCVGISSSTQPNWWDQDQQVHTLSASSSWPWHHRQQMQQQQPNPNSTNSSCDEDVSMSSTSFTNASNHSSLSVDSSRRPEDLNLIGEQVSDSQIWSQVLLSVGNNCDLNSNNITRGVGENFLDSISSKSLTNTAARAMYEEAACDYLKKLDNSTGSNWENVTNSSNFNNFEKQINVNNSQFSSENLSSLVSTWSIAPPEPQVVNSTANPFFMSMPQVSYYGQDEHNRKVENFESNLHGRPFSTSNGTAEYQIGLNNAMAADQSNYYGSCENGQFLPDVYSSCPNTGISRSNNADVISPSYDRLGKPVTNPNHHHAPKPGNFKSLIPDSTSKKQGLRTSSAQSTITSERVLQGSSVNEGKKKRADESITSSGGTVVKKPKQETSTVNSSTVKMQAPKVKLGDRITALQQIVSPFGKTDTASVLYEAIQYIKFLQDQVNVLLSSPYMKTNSQNGKYDNAMGDQRGDVDLKSKGLCLVPTSCTPQVYRENTGSDYWPTPIYRGCLYR